MKLLLLVALVGAAVASPLAENVPAFALNLKGPALTQYINTVQKGWTAAEPKQSRRKSLMNVKYTKHPEGSPVSAVISHIEAAAIPDTFDARTNWPKCPTIGNIRDQSDCGSCWAFGAAESMSDRTCIASDGKVQLTLSADDLLSCCGSFCGYGCEGGYPIRAWNFWVRSGVCTGSGFYENEGCKPYPIEPCGTHTVNNHTYHHSCDGGEEDTPKCTSACLNAGYPTSYKDDKHFGKSAYTVRNSVSEIQKEIMTNGPVEAAFTVYEDFERYTGGVYKHTAGGVLGGHAVKILGWGKQDGQDYWLVANSWNIEWGENGFFKIIRGKNDCGIEEAIVAGLPKL